MACETLSLFLLSNKSLEAVCGVAIARVGDPLFFWRLPSDPRSDEAFVR